MIRKRFCAFLRTDGQCAFRREMCKFEHGDAPCPDAVRRVVHVVHVSEMISRDLGALRGDECMSPGDRDRGIYWSCKRKCRYRNESDARRYARKMTLRYGVPMYLYFCDICEGYHLTKIPQ